MGRRAHASAYSPACPQLPSLTGTPSEKEDCLYLNVWTPDSAPAEPLPVMVWIHGGSNMVGSTGDFIPLPPFQDVRLYDAHRLAADRKVVVVTLNYRVGVFGFFGHTALASEDPSYPYAGNQALLDQRAALMWVRDNIAAFGGDPGNVTIFGESAGSLDVCAHVASPMTNGSSTVPSARAAAVPPASTPRPAPDPRRRDQRRGRVRRRARRARVLARDVGARAARRHGSASGGEFTQGLMSVDGGFLEETPRETFDRGDLPKIQYILGANSDEGSLFFFGSPELTPEEYSCGARDTIRHARAGGRGALSGLQVQ